MLGIKFDKLFSLSSSNVCQNCGVTTNGVSICADCSGELIAGFNENAQNDDNNFSEIVEPQKLA